MRTSQHLEWPPKNMVERDHGRCVVTADGDIETHVCMACDRCTIVTRMKLCGEPWLDDAQRALKIMALDGHPCTDAWHDEVTC